MPHPVLIFRTGCFFAYCFKLTIKRAVNLQIYVRLFWLTPARELSALTTEGEISYATAYFFMLSLGFAPCLISSHPSAPLGVLLSIETKQSNEKPN